MCRNHGQHSAFAYIRSYFLMVYFSFCKVLVIAPFSFLILITEVYFFPWLVWLKVSQFVDLLKEPTFGFVDFVYFYFFTSFSSISVFIISS